MIWSVPRLWDGGECWIIGGGPSLQREFQIPDDVVQGVLSKQLPLSAYSPYMAAIHDKHVIGVNMAFALGSWVDMLFFGDKKWYLTRRVEIAEFKGLKVTCHQFFDKPQFEREDVKCVRKDNTSHGISSDPRKAVWNANSGAAAISVAANMGVKQIVLVGFDMKLDNKKLQHWHAQYGTYNRWNGQKVDPANLPFKKHLMGFPRIAKDARARGIRIVNACPDSMITVFPRMTVRNALGLDQWPEIREITDAEIRAAKAPNLRPGKVQNPEINPRKHGRIIRR